MHHYLIRLRFDYPYIYNNISHPIYTRPKKKPYITIFRYLKKVRDALPATPKKAAAVLSAYVHKSRMSRSPAVKAFHGNNTLDSSSAEDRVGEEALASIKSFLSTVKTRRSDEARSTLKVLKSSVSGENVTEHGKATRLAKRLGIKPAAIKGGKRIRTEILHSQESAYEYTKRKTRSDAITNDVKETVFDYWLRDGNSRPSNNKNDVKRVRIGPKMYSVHTNYILEKTQTEVYQQFQKDYPDIKIGQRAFERCKPYFIRPASIKDKVTCCCRQHVEARALFRTCSAYQKKIQLENRAENINVFETLTNLCNATICPPSANTRQHKLSCLNRTCDECGVDTITLIPTDFEENNDTVKWEKYEYQNVTIKGDVSVRKLVLVKKETCPSEMFNYFLQLLQTFPAHQYRAAWQTKQLKTLTTSLPHEHCLAIHDFAENYKCSEINEIQSSYFQKVEVSLHVSILHRHAVLEVDGVDSTEEDPNIVTEHFFVVSPCQTHDHHFTHTVQTLIADYLRSINCPVTVMHEFTDGCASQYKSRHCLGDMSHSCRELGYKQIIRNFFETSHGRGPQDAAGGLIKRQTDLAVYRGGVNIQNALDVFNFAKENLEGTTDSAKCRRRIFRYVETINRQRERYFHPIKDIRKLHQAIVVNKGKLAVRQLSCYSCKNCASGEYALCLNESSIGVSTKITVKKEMKGMDSNMHEEMEAEELCDLVAPGQIVALRALDDRYPYYVMRVSTKPYVSAVRERDAWGSEFSAGAYIIKGHYFDSIPEDAFTLRLLPRLPVIAPAHAIAYICSEVEVSEIGTLHINDSLHRRILKAME